MQQKRKVPVLRIFLLFLALLIVIFVVALMTAEVPANPQPIEQPLDAKQFLEQKQ